MWENTSIQLPLLTDRIVFFPVRKLTTVLARRKWGTSESEVAEKGSHVQHFECLVCTRIGQREAHLKAGFRQVSFFYY